MGDKIEVIKSYGSLNNYAEYYVFTNRNYHVIQGYQRQLQNINYREELLKQSISAFPTLAKLEKEMRPYYEMWNIAYDITNRVDSMKIEPINTIKYD